MQWVANKSARPAIYHDLVDGKKVLATVRRVDPKRLPSGKYTYSYQVIRKWIGITGGAYGHVWPSLIEAKRNAEHEVKATEGGG